MKRLYKDEKRGKLFGVCEGIGQYFNIDPSIVRLIFLVAFFYKGWGVIPYIILTIALPNND